MERITGIDVVKSNQLPTTFYDEEESRMVTTHMITVGDTVYVSPEWFEKLKKEWGNNG